MLDLFTKYGVMAQGDGLTPRPTGTVLLLHMDGANNSTTFTDSSSSPKTFTARGDAKISTAQSKFGGASAYFDGAGDYIDAPDSNDFTLGNSDFVIDCWVQRPAVSQDRFLFGQMHSSGDPTQSSVYAKFKADNTLYIACCHSSGAVYLDLLNAVTDSEWHHIAFIRHSGYVYGYIDGVQKGSVSIGTTSLNNSAVKFAIGRAGEFTSTPFYGYIDEFCMSVGTARWTGNFTPPTRPYA